MENKIPFVFPFYSEKKSLAIEKKRLEIVNKKSYPQAEKKHKKLLGPQ